MKLFVNERLRLLELLPATGDIGQMRATRELKEMLEPDAEDEKRGLKVEPTEGGLRFDWGSEDWEREFDIPPKGLAIAVDALKKLNDTKELTDGHITLYEKLVEA